MKKNNLFVAGILALALVSGMALFGCKNNVSPSIDPPTVSDLEVGTASGTDFTPKTTFSTSERIIVKVHVTAGTNPVNKVYVTVKKSDSTTTFTTNPSITSGASQILLIHNWTDSEKNFGITTSNTYTVTCYAEDSTSKRSAAVIITKVITVSS
jgi:hypothetical protein